LGTASSGRATAYPNREELPAAVLSFVGALPILWLVLVVFLTMILLWAASAGSIFFLLLVVVLALACIALAVVALRSIRRSTPTSLQLESSRLVAIWPGPHGRRESIPFEHITAVDPRQWRWTYGKGGYAHYTPPTVRYSLKSIEQGPDSKDDADYPAIFLTAANAARVDSALRTWSLGVPGELRAGVPSALDSVGAKWRPAVWSECMLCGGPLEGEGERESGVCARCKPLEA
jgi:hypothetical protein